MATIKRSNSINRVPLIAVANQCPSHLIAGSGLDTLTEHALMKKKKKEKRENLMFEMAKLMNPFVSPDAKPDYVIEVTNKRD